VGQKALGLEISAVDQDSWDFRHSGSTVKKDWPNQFHRRKAGQTSPALWFLGATKGQLRRFLSGGLGFDVAVLGCGMLYRRVDLAADQECPARHLKPKYKNYYRSQRAVGLAVAIEEMQLSAQGGGRDRPRSDFNHRSRRDPVLVLLVRAKAVYS
jgi:hypothetical protein